MTSSQKKQYAQAYSKVNARIEKWGRTLFYKTLRLQTKEIRSLLNQYPLEYVEFHLSSIISEKPFKDAFNEFYPKAGEKLLRFHEGMFEIETRKDKDPTRDPIGQINLTFRNERKIAELAKVSQNAEVASKITKITQYTRDIIKQTIQKGIADNLTKKQIANQIFSKTQGFIARDRAMNIARTETTYISSLAAEINVQDSPFKLEKLWIPVSDFRTREPHRAMLSKSAIPKEQLFNVGGIGMMYPGDPRGGASNCCNCRCTIVYKPIPNQQEERIESGSLLNSLLIGELLRQILED